MPATIKDIAKALGLSPSTVSRALHDHPQINEETKKSIHAIAKRMNYKPNRAAAGLRTQKTYCIGLVVPHVSNHFFATVLSGIQQVASAQGYQLLICQTMEKEVEEKKYVDALISGRVDGLLLALSSGTKNFDHIKYAKSEMPVVLFDRVNPDLDTPQIEAKDHEGSYKATAHLIKRGCKNIGYLSGSRGLRVAQNRLEGYKSALKEHKMAVEEEMIVDCDWDKNKVPEALQSLLRHNAALDGIVAANDEVAVQAILELKKLKLKVPDEIAVVGFGNYPISEIVEPALTTVKHHPRRIGANATHTLISMIDESYKDWEEEFITSDLIKRDSA